MSLIKNKKNKWIKIEIVTSEFLTDILSNYLFEKGSSGLWIEGEKENRVNAYFMDNSNIDILLNGVKNYIGSLNTIFPDIKKPKVKIKKLYERDRLKIWRARLKPIKLSKSIVIVPPEYKYKTGNGCAEIRIGADMAFGSGEHPTTQFCIKAMDKFLHPQMNEIIDVGTGSGILGIIASKCFRLKVIAIDTDFNALKVALKNIIRNNQQKNIRLLCGRLEVLNGTYKAIVSNLTTEDHLEYISTYKRLLDKNGIIILSGILRSKIELLRSTYINYGFKELKMLCNKEWVCLIFENNI